MVEEEEKISLKMTPKMMKVDVAGVCDGSGCISHWAIDISKILDIIDLYFH